jgi:DNA-binding MurR/RpiR family transcriptional regulator
MTKAEQKTADVFLESPDSFAFSTLDKISRTINTSTTTTIRFCRTLGFQGYKEFQDAVRQELKLMATLPQKLLNLSNENLDNTLLESIVERGIQNIYRTFNEIPPKTMQQAINRIIDGKRLFMFGMRESFALVHYAYSRFLTVRNNVFILDAGFNGIVEPLLSLDKDDVCLVFAFQRYSKLSLRILPLLKKQGAHIILVTSSPYDRLAPYADTIIHCHLDIGSIKNSSLAPVCLLDYLCSAASMKSQSDMLARMNVIENTLQSSGVV